MHVKLKVLRGGSAGKEIAVRVPKFLIGRAEECHVRVNSDAISRRHCAITLEEDDVKIRDLGSRNGTYVNGVRIDGPQRIQMGDQLRVGPLEFLVTYAKSSEAVGKPSASGTPTASSDDMGGLISDWLSEADENDRRTRGVESETRAFRLDETDRIKVEPIPTGDTKPEVPVENEAPDDERSSTSTFVKKTTAKNAAPKDTQEAAAQTLRKFFNRGS